MSRAIATFGLLGVVLTGCGDLSFDFDFTHESEEYNIMTDPLDASESTDDSAQLTLDFSGGWTTFSFDADVLTLDQRIDGLQVLDAVVYGTAGDSETDADLSFVQRMEIYVVGEDGLPSFLLASYERDGELRNPAVLPLHIHEDVNLVDYMQDGLEFYTFLQGEHPERDVTFRTALDFKGFSRGY